MIMRKRMMILMMSRGMIDLFVKAVIFVDLDFEPRSLWVVIFLFSEEIFHFHNLRNRRKSRFIKCPIL